MGRLWQTLILSQWHPLFLSLPLESMIKDHQAQYYHVLEQADEQADSTVFIHFMLSTIAKTLAQALAQNAPVNIAGLKTHEAIVLLLQHNPHLTRQQLDNLVGKVP